MYHMEGRPGKTLCGLDLDVVEELTPDPRWVECGRCNRVLHGQRAHTYLAVYRAGYRLGFDQAVMDLNVWSFETHEADCTCGICQLVQKLLRKALGVKAEAS